MKAAFLIRSLGVGGAERQIAALAAGLAAAGHAVTVHVFYAGGALEADLRASGVHVLDLAKGGRWNFGGFLVRLVRSMRAARPDVIYSVLDVPNVLVAVLRPFLGGARIGWGLRSTYVDYSRYDWSRAFANRVECWLSRVPDLIVVNSRAGARHARGLGFPAARLCVVRNGIDTARFRPDPQGRRRVRAQWGVADGECVIGVVARFDPIKDLGRFLAAAAQLDAAAPGAYRFVLVGGGAPAQEAELLRQARELGIEGRVIFSGAALDMPAVYSALDIQCSSSIGEGFSNVLAEGMACGVPCVATDVGDSADIAADCGVIVPPRDGAALAQGLQEMAGRVAREGETLSAACRAHIERHFALQRLVEETARVLGGDEARAVCVEGTP